MPSLHPKALLLRDLIDSERPIYIMGIIVQELLQCVREKSQFSKMRKCLEPFPMLEPGYETYVAAAGLASQCREKGIQTGTIDILIAAAAIEFECHLLTTDKDFEHIAKATHLKLL